MATIDGGLGWQDRLVISHPGIAFWWPPLGILMRYDTTPIVIWPISQSINQSTVELSFAITANSFFSPDCLY